MSGQVTPVATGKGNTGVGDGEAAVDELAGGEAELDAVAVGVIDPVGEAVIEGLAPGMLVVWVAEAAWPQPASRAVSRASPRRNDPWRTKTKRYGKAKRYGAEGHP